MKKIHFQKQAGLCFNSVTTDGKYLYIYVSALNGGMWKVGTGNFGSVAGKVYHSRSIFYQIGQKPDEVSWVYLKGKLYAKISCKDPWFIDVINVDTLKK